MMKPVYIVDIMREISNAVSAQILSTIQANEAEALGESAIQVINYDHGSGPEVLETLYQMTMSEEEQTKKYPMIYLVQDFGEEHGLTIGVSAEVSLNVLLIHQTEQTYKITDRYTKVFKPVLYPIYYSFLEQVSKSKWIVSGPEEMLRHRKTDRSFWGRQAAANRTDKYKLQDFVDAIEIENLGLKFKFSC